MPVFATPPWLEKDPACAEPFQYGLFNGDDRLPTNPLKRSGAEMRIAAERNAIARAETWQATADAAKKNTGFAAACTDDFDLGSFINEECVQEEDIVTTASSAKYSQASGNLSRDGTIHPGMAIQTTGASQPPIRHEHLPGEPTQNHSLSISADPVHHMSSTMLEDRLPNQDNTPLATSRPVTAVQGSEIANNGRGEPSHASDGTDHTSVTQACPIISVRDLPNDQTPTPRPSQIETRIYTSPCLNPNQQSSATQSNDESNVSVKTPQTEPILAHKTKCDEEAEDGQQTAKGGEGRENV